MCAILRPKTYLPLVLAILTASVGFAQQRGQTRAEGEFYRGYYLQHESHQIAEAIKAYKHAIELGANAKTRAAVDAEMAQLQEELATTDFASVMPADALAYVEISNPASHIEKIARIMGLVGKQFSPSDEKVTIRIEDEIAISSDFQISPALLREFKKIRGAAVAITGIRDNDPPAEGIAVIHPGDSDLLTGLLETGVQLVQATDSLGGFPTYNVDGKVWIVKTNRLVLVSDSKTRIAECLKRISDQKSESLADDANFQFARSQNKDAALFAYASPAKLVKKYESKFQGELAMVRMVLDLDHMQHVTSAFTATDNGLRSRINVKYTEDHNSFGYGLIRTVPLSKKALSHIPSGSAVVVGMGLNPKLILAAQAAGHQQLSALDIGREVFANIEELGVFVLPSTTSENDEIPNVGVVIASSDIKKSESLWNQLLSLPAKMDIEEGPSAKDISIAGVNAHQYTFADEEIPQLVIARLGDDAMVAGTRAAVEATIKASKNGKTLANDSRAAPFWDVKSKHTSKAAFVNVGQALKLAASIEGGNDADEMRMISEVIQDLVVTLVVNEAPADLEIQTDVVGLPQFSEVIKSLSKFQSQDGGERSHAAEAHPADEPQQISTVIK